MGTIALGSGMALGEHEVKNDDLARVCDTTDDWIRERTGIHTRHYVAEGTSTSDLGVRAARAAIADAQLTPRDIDYVIFATMTPDYYFPGSGVILQHKLGVGQVPTLDIRQQCTGFIYGLQVADALLKAGVAKKVLLVGAEVHSGFMPWKDHGVVFGTSSAKISDEERAFNTRYRDRTVLFGDAAGAVVLARDEEPHGLVDTVMHSDGQFAEKLYVPSGFKWRPYITEAMVREGRHIPEMDGQRVFRHALAKLPEVVHEVLRRNGLTLADVTLLLAHQANLRLNEAVQKALGLPDARVYNNIQRYGNTTAATIPIAYHECRHNGRIARGDLVCFVALGAGFHWGAALMRH
ncbi:MAG TPA: 3-oxoacyl-[acyl-carrier-protein] synthase III C-terminal domain-containing protein [Polyangia bacterium]|jgi:3-oxoacyl-[acyl-carrier-protein] synthase-3|nr:3-oxoacyl-[acyl-carrier-protein] synthase III C-terminal domain-containing protein [Polyangia bacterium]